MRRSVVIAVSAVVLIVAVVAILSLRSSSSDSRLGEKLLSADQVPSTWQSESFQNAAKGTGCLARIMTPKGFQQSAASSVLYTNYGNAPPEVGEAIATFRNTDSAFRQIVSSLQSCVAIHNDNPASTVYGSIVPLLLPNYGVASEAVVATITDQAVPVTLTDDLVFLRQGKYVVEVFEAGIGKVNKQQFEKYVSKAVLKL